MIKQTLTHITRIIIILVLIGLIIATISFTFLQIQISQTLDEALVADLTTQLDIKLIDQIIQKIFPPVE